MKLALLIEKKNALLKALSIEWLGVLQVIIGSLFLGLMAQLAIYLPFTPVPISMQTLGVSLLAISLGPKKAVLAVLAYLGQASIGLPVLAGGISNPWWILGPKAGYLIGFMVSAYVVGTLLEKKRSSSFFMNCLIVALNESIILGIGAMWLSLFVGTESALAMGVLPFIMGGFIKMTIAACAIKPIEWIKSTSK